MQKMPQENPKLGNERKENDLRCSHLWEDKSENHRRCKECGLNQLFKNIQQKCDTMQNWRLILKMCDEQDWILRSTIIWHKPNCMPSSVKDRFTMDYEPVFFFSKSKKYWFEPQYEPHIAPERQGESNSGFDYGENRNNKKFLNQYNPLGRNKRSVWKIATKPYPEAHFATFPPELIEAPIKAGCPEFICRKCGKGREKIFEKEKFASEGQPPVGTKQQGEKYRGHREGELKYGERYEVKHIPIGYTDCGCNSGWESGITLDPFMGSGTTALVARNLDRNYIGIELKPEYIKLAEKRLSQQKLL